MFSPILQSNFLSKYERLKIEKEPLVSLFMKKKADADVSLIDPSLQDITNEFMQDIFLPIDLKKRSKKKVKPNFKNYDLESKSPQIVSLKLPQENISIDQYPSSARQSNKSRKIIGPTHHLFFFPLKLKNSKNTCFFLFNYPFICVYIMDSNYTFQNIFGKLEYENFMGSLKTDYTMLKSGLLHKATGGYIIFQAE